VDTGYVLGGGLGPLTRSFGMGCDTLKQATIVTADGCTVTVRTPIIQGHPKASSSGHSAVPVVAISVL
jgi:hypothetical protein